MDALIIDKKDNIVDGLNIGYSVNLSYNWSARFFFIDDKKNIYRKDFFNDELQTYFTRYQKYRINPQGKFIRYYEADGFIKNDDEQGLVKNHTREGKWIEMSNIYYIEKEYKEGVSINEWKYYKMVQNFTEEGYPILSTRRKGDLFYSETYENGRLVKREFVK